MKFKLHKNWIESWKKIQKAHKYKNEKTYKKILDCKKYLTWKFQVKALKLYKQNLQDHF